MTPVQERVAALIALFAVAALIWLLAPVLTPFAIGAGLAYLCDPIVDRLERLGLGRTAGVIIVFVTVAASLAVLVLVLIPVLQHQVIDLVHNIPAYINWVRQNIAPMLG